MAPSAPNSDNVTDNVAGTAASELTAPDRPQREGRGPRADRQDRGDRGDRGGRQRGPRPDRNDGNDRGDRNRGPRDARFGDSDLRDGGGRRIDLSPPKFNVDELFAVAGPPLWQAVHAATVVEVTEAAIIVELKPEGHPALKAMIKSNEWPDAAVGAAAQVRLLDPAKANQPMPMASLRQAQDLQRLADLAVLQTQDRPIVQGTIVHEVRGGYAVAVQATDEIGDGALRAFLPFSQATMNRFGPGRGEKMLDLSDTFAVTEIDVQRMNIVVSRKAIMNALRDHDMQQKLAALTEGAIVKGTIRSIVAYGAFLDVDGVDALLHRDDVAHDFRGRIDAHLKTGDVLNVKVLSVKENKLKVGLKQTKGDPWAEVRAAFASGTVVKGTIVSLADFGAFVRLPLPSNPQESVEGLIHVSEISYSKIRHPSTKFSIGQEVDVKVLGLDAEHRRISLSTRVLERNPFEAVAEKFPAGTVIRAKIKTLAEFGAFLELADGVDGLIHISELSWTEAPNHPSEVVNIGQEVEAVVMGVDVAKQRVSCSMKRTQQNPFDAWEQKYQPGTRLQMKVIKAEDKGCFLEVEAGLSCFCSWRDLVDVNGQAVERAQDAVKLNQMIDVQVRSFERRFKKVSVSMRAIVESDTKAAYDEYKQREQAGPLNSMADALRKRETKS